MKPLITAFAALALSACGQVNSDTNPLRVGGSVQACVVASNASCSNEAVQKVTCTTPGGQSSTYNFSCSSLVGLNACVSKTGTGATCELSK